MPVNFLLHPWDITKNIGIFYLFTLSAKELSVGKEPAVFMLNNFQLVKSLRSLRSDRGLDVVPLEVLLQVEDGEAVLLREAKKLAESDIRLDGLLVRELVVLGVLHDAAGDV